MTAHARIDLIIPHKNRLDQLQSAIRSIDSPCLIENIIVVDDFSHPGQVPEQKELQPAVSGSAVVVVANEGLPGAQHARIAGIRRSKADWIMFLDSDDEIIPGALSDVLETLSTVSSNTVLVYGDYYAGERLVRTQRLRGNCYREVLRNLSLAPFSGLCVRNTSIPIDRLESMLPSWQDDDFLIEMARSGRIQHVDRPIARLNSGVDRISASAQRQHEGLRLLLMKWNPELLRLYGRFRSFLWRMRLFRILIKSRYQSSLAEIKGAPPARRVFGILFLATCKAIDILMYVLLSPFFYRIYV